MVVYGSFAQFSSFLPKGSIEFAFEKMIEIWPTFTRFPDRQLENNITQPFVNHLQVAAERDNWPIDFDYRVKFTQAAAPVEAGEGDIVIRPWPGGRSGRGFVIECKRLNVLYPSGFRTDVEKYVGAGGMGDFLSGKYDRNCSDGGMLGYAMDDRVTAAREAVNTELLEKALEVRSNPPNQLTPAGFNDVGLPVSVTVHAMPESDDFTIYHLFLPYSGSEIS